MFTYGPFGFLLTDAYHPATFAATTAIFAGLALLIALVAWRIARARFVSPWACLLATILVVEAMCAWEPRQNFFTHLAFLALWFSWSLEKRRADAPPSRLDVGLLHALAVALALGAWTKFTCSFSGIVPVAVVALCDVVRRRRVPWVLATHAASLLAFWLLAGQPLSALSDYVSSALDVVGGYGSSMAGNGPVGDLLLFLAVGLVLLALFARLWGFRLADGSAAHVLGLAALLFLAFKTGFVRFEVPHTMLASTALLLWLVAGASAHPRKEVIALGVAAAGMLVVLVGWIQPNGPGTGLPSVLANSMRALPEEVSAAGRVLAGRTGFDARHASALEAIRRDAPVPQLAGSVDVLTTLGSLALANGLDYQPRPVFQSYCAFTPSLLRKNAEYLGGPRAPDHLLFTVRGSIDLRVPSMDDSLSWPILLSRYDVRGVAARHLVLEKRPSPRTVSWRALGSRRAGFGQMIPPPNEARRGTALWVEIEVHPTARERATALLFHPPILSIVLRTAGGEMLGYRLVPGIARAGFLLSPAIRTDEEFTALAQGGRASLATSEVQALGVGAPDGSDVGWAYGPEYEVRFSALEIGP